MQTREEYLKEAEREIGEKEFQQLRVSIDNEFYEVVATEAKQGHPISKAVYDSLSEGQRFHFNKHYNHRGTLVQG